MARPLLSAMVSCCSVACCSAGDSAALLQLRNSSEHLSVHKGVATSDEELFSGSYGEWPPNPFAGVKTNPFGSNPLSINPLTIPEQLRQFRVGLGMLEDAMGHLQARVQEMRGEVQVAFNLWHEAVGPQDLDVDGADGAVLIRALPAFSNVGKIFYEGIERSIEVAKGEGRVVAEYFTEGEGTSAPPIIRDVAELCFSQEKWKNITDMYRPPMMDCKQALSRASSTTEGRRQALQECRAVLLSMKSDVEGAHHRIYGLESSGRARGALGVARVALTPFLGKETLDRCDMQLDAIFHLTHDMDLFFQQLSHLLV